MLDSDIQGKYAGSASKRLLISCLLSFLSVNFLDNVSQHLQNYLGWNHTEGAWCWHKSGLSGYFCKSREDVCITNMMITDTCINQMKQVHPTQEFVEGGLQNFLGCSPLYHRIFWQWSPGIWWGVSNISFQPDCTNWALANISARSENGSGLIKTIQCNLNIFWNSLLNQ